MFPVIPNPTTEETAQAFGPGDLLRRSATKMDMPASRQTEVAKLIDVSKCIGCKACQTACMEWNELVEEVGINTGVYENPHDLTANSWTLMRYTEYENEQGNLEWLIRKDGCMHCDPAVSRRPAPGNCQYTNGIVDFVQENCIGCGYCIKGCPFNIRACRKPTTRPTNARSASIASRSDGVLPAPRHVRRRQSSSAPSRK